MRKADPFSGIPAVPNSIAGQWLAFSHMANHYRKLFNAKPRVESFAPKTSLGLKEVHPLSAYLKGAHLLNKPTPLPASKPKFCSSPSCSLSNPRKPKECPVAKAKSVLKSQSVQHNNAAMMTSVGSSPRSIMKRSSTSTKKSTKAKTSSASDYKLVYKSASLHSSTTDHFGSDFDRSVDLEEPSVETMGVAEKIKAFLENIPHFSPTPPSKRKSKTVPPKAAPSKMTTCSQKKSCCSVGNGKKQMAELKASRHSNCFIPVTDAPKRKKGTLNTNSQKLSHHLTQTKSKTNTLTIMAPSQTNKAKLEKEEKRRYLSGDSVGTIRGSEELTAEDNLQPFTTHSLDYKGEFIPVPKLKQSSCLKGTRTSSAGYCSQSASGKATSLSSSGVLKDSSRDSAYGFSSGESRITTRESTPEKLTKGKSKSKKGADRSKYKSALSTVASSVNLDACGNVKKSIKTKLENSEDKYLNFLTGVTDDIVTRGIYTNKGLKELFTEHIKKNKKLSTERMKDLLEKLRMDLGIPKNNNLNKLEFGYGSVLHSSTSPHFYHNGSPTKNSVPAPPPRRLKNKPFHLELRRDIDAVISDDVIPPPPPHNSRVNQDLQADDPDSASDYVEEIQDDTKSDETSLSETEFKRTLKEVGIDSETTLEIVGLMKLNKNHPDPSIDSSSNTTTTSDDNSSRSFTRKSVQVHKSKSCSVSSNISS